MRKFYWIVLFSSCISLAGSAQENKLNDLLKDFQSTDWPTVLNAKESLENLEGNSISSLIGLMKDKSNKKLVNAGDLIYPGAERFFGHGQIIEYDIDKLDVRAGWLLEDITFQNFGFTGVHIEETALLDFIRLNFPEYYNNKANKQNLASESENAKREIIRNLSIEKAENWWKSASDKWSRYDALINSLQSDDEKMQVKGLFYIRYGKSVCSGLTKESYKQKIEPLVVKLAKSPIKRISEQAKLILYDSDFEWLTSKQMMK